MVDRQKEDYIEKTENFKQLNKNRFMNKTQLDFIADRCIENLIDR